MILLVLVCYGCFSVIVSNLVEKIPYIPYNFHEFKNDLDIGGDCDSC